MNDYKLNEKDIIPPASPSPPSKAHTRRLFFFIFSILIFIRLQIGYNGFTNSSLVFSPLFNTPSYLQSLFIETPIIGGLTKQNKNKKKKEIFPDIEFDGSSLSLLGQRIYIQAGEFHPWRLPVTDLWRDILEKAKAGGINTISIYTHWGLSNPSPGVFDWEGFRSLSLFLDIAQEVGLWVIVRPGPYINAETTAGGIPGWVTTIKGELRTNATDYKEAWEPYIRQVCQITKKYQISQGGPVILMQVENELSNRTGNAEHFKEIYDVMKSEGIVVPLTFNDWARQDFYASGPIAADIYGFDDYPQHFDCSNPTIWAPVVTEYASFHAYANPDQPLYIPEFQGGAFDAWGPTSPSYDSCRELTGADFESVFYLHLWASNVKMLSIYMLYGGTSWGLLPFPGVYTSYDYGAAITESRELGSKFDELKRQSLYLRSVRDFANTYIVSNSSKVKGFEPEAFWTELRNPETGAGFYIVRHLDSSSNSKLSFDMTIQTERGVIELNSKTQTDITLYGRQSKMITTDLNYGAASRLAYTTGGILFAGKIGSRDVLFLHGDPLDKISLALDHKYDSMRSAGPAKFEINANKDISTFIFSNPSSSISTVLTSSNQLIIYTDSIVAGTFWNPTISSDPTNPRSNFYSFGTNETILVGGPYLVRNASISHSTLHLIGDLVASYELESSTILTIFAPESVRSITWNSIPVTLDMNHHLSPFGALVGTVSVSKVEFEVPILENWKMKDSLPEIRRDFDDSDWIQAKEGALNNPYPPLYGDLWLYSCEYGFCEGVTTWRGTFSREDATGVKLSLSGGEAFAGSVWLNDVFLGSSFGNSTNNQNIIATTNETFYFSQGSLYPDNNVLTILVDNMGQDEGNEEPKHPRGVQGYELIGGKGFTSWKVQGKKGGNVNFPDKKRGITNEGGFHGERGGWHLPNFDDSTWELQHPSSGLPSSGVVMFRTEFNLDIPESIEIPISFEFTGLDTGSNLNSFRSQLYVNGWNYGKFVSNLGPQEVFPVPNGILNVNGKNTVAVIFWVTGIDGASFDLSIRKGAAFSTGSKSIA